MDKTSRIYLAGHAGLVGSAIKRRLENNGYRNIIVRTLAQLDLTNQESVNRFFEEEKPEYVFLAAALVGGIVANNTYRADFIYHNLMIQNNVIYAAWKSNVKKLLFLGSTCIYPKDAPQPLKEESLLTSPLEYTNEPYAVAKIAGLKMCESFNIQYGTNFIAVMPTNLYGPGDNFDLQKSHVLPALMRKIYLGKCLETNDWEGIRKDLDRYPVGKTSGKSDKTEILQVLASYGVSDQNGDGTGQVSVNVWGTGTPLREFMYSEDMADACIYIMEKTDVQDIINMDPKTRQPGYKAPHFLNIGTSEEVTISDLAGKLKKLIGFRGNVVFDTTKPDGTMRKVTDTSRLKSLGYRFKYNLDEGLKENFKAYLK
ncbi:MAG: GDP-L-fucose synthase [Bacteroidales bacterium]